jgi:hypothetical protein
MYSVCGNLATANARVCLYNLKADKHETKPSEMHTKNNKTYLVTNPLTTRLETGDRYNQVTE